MKKLKRKMEKSRVILFCEMASFIEEEFARMDVIVMDALSREKIKRLKRMLDRLAEIMIRAEGK